MAYQIIAWNNKDYSKLGLDNFLQICYILELIELQF